MASERFPRKILSVAVNRKDGGVMVTPHLQNWDETVCSQLIVPETGGLMPLEDSCVKTGPNNRPKLHYHRSGMSSVQPQQFTGGQGRRTIHLPSLDGLDGVQIFSIVARVPSRFPWDQDVRPGDIVQIMDRPGVRTLFVSGVIYERNKIPARSIGGPEKMAPVTMASNHSNVVLVDLSGYGLEAVLALHFDPSPRAMPHFVPDFSLVSFHQNRMPLDGAVAIHAGPGIPCAAILSPIPSVAAMHEVSRMNLVTSVIESIRPEI